MTDDMQMKPGRGNAFGDFAFLFVHFSFFFFLLIFIFSPFLSVFTEGVNCNDVGKDEVKREIIL